jgi:hypothetical protein
MVNKENLKGFLNKENWVYMEKSEYNFIILVY